MRPAPVSGPARAALVVALVASCGPTVDEEPLVLTLDPAILPADGASSSTLTIVSTRPVVDAVVSVGAPGVVVGQSTAALVDDAATVELFAPTEAALGRAARRTVTVTAQLALADDDVRTATATHELVPPEDGDPLLFAAAEPAAAVADGASDVTVVVSTRRIADGAPLVVTTDAGLEVPTEITVTDGAASFVVTAPSSPVDAALTVTHAATGASTTVVVRFVADGAPLFDLTGTFAQLGDARVKLSSPLLTPDPQCVSAPSVVKVELVQTDLVVEARYETCVVGFPPVTSVAGTVTNSAPPPFYAAIPVVEQATTLASGALGALYDPGASTVVAGAVLDDPATDALPTDASDPRVVDADQDGAPGVTVVNSLGGEQSIVYRNIGRARGRVVSSNQITGDTVGDLVTTTETSVFGLGAAVYPEVSGLPSVVELVRVDGRFASAALDRDGDGEVSCAEIADEALTLVTLDALDTPFDCAGID